ncbi:MAG: hypothetical protein AB7G24_00860 [Novosphingobium sp.]
MKRGRVNVAGMQLQLLRGSPPMLPGTPGEPSRLSTHQLARELLVLATRAAEFSGTGPTASLPNALRTIERMRALLKETQ